VGPTTGLEDVEERKFLTLPGLVNFDPSVVKPVASHCTDYVVPAPLSKSREIEKKGSWFPRGSESRMTVLAKTSSLPQIQTETILRR
jgi:hypothetical protein